MNRYKYFFYMPPPNLKDGTLLSEFKRIEIVVDENEDVMSKLEEAAMTTGLFQLKSDINAVSLKNLGFKLHYIGPI